MNPFAKSLLKPGDNPMDLKVPNLQDSMQWLLEEVDTLVEQGHEKKTIGLPDLQGPLNVAMKLVGDNQMLSLIARRSKAEVVEHILEVAADAYIEIYQTLRKATGRDPISNFSVSGCTYYYISPKQWTKFILPVVKKCEALGNGIRLHHCGEADSGRIDAYSKYPWNAVEFGFGSDLALARKVFDHPKLGALEMSCRMSPYRMLNQSADQITSDIEGIISQVKGGPASINCVGVPYGTPEENLWALWNAVDAYNKAKEAEADDDDW